MRIAVVLRAVALHGLLLQGELDEHETGPGARVGDVGAGAGAFRDEDGELSCVLLSAQLPLTPRRYRSTRR